MIKNDSYYHFLFNKICEMPEGETVLNHKNEIEKEKFEEHIKMWIETEMFLPHGFYIEFNDTYTAIKKVENFYLKLN